MQLTVEESAALHYLLLVCIHQLHNFGLRRDGGGNEWWLALKVRRQDIKSVLMLEILLISFHTLYFFFRNGSSNPPCAWTHSTELDYCRSEMSELRVWRIFSSGLIDSVLLEFICGICSVKTYFVCCVFQLLVVTVARISCTHVMLLFVSISSLSGFSELLSSVICRIWFQGSLFPFFFFYLYWIFFPLRFSQSGFLNWFEVLMFTGSVTFFSFSDPDLGAFWMLFFQTFNFLWPSESQNKQKPSAPSNLYVLTGNCISLLIETQDGSQITEDPLGLFYFDSVIYKWSRCKRTGRINYL